MLYEELTSLKEQSLLWWTCCRGPETHRCHARRSGYCWFPRETSCQWTSCNHQPSHDTIWYIYTVYASYGGRVHRRSFSTISLRIFSGLLLGLIPFTLHSMHFFTRSLSSFVETCLCHLNHFRSLIVIISSVPSLSVKSLNVKFVRNFHASSTSSFSSQPKNNQRKTTIKNDQFRKIQS